MRWIRIYVGAMLLALAAGPASPAMAVMPDRALLHGRVADSDGRPLAGAFINVSDSQGRTLGNTQSGRDGRYQMSVATAEPYNVWAGITNNFLFSYIPETKNTQNSTADFYLRPGGNIIIAAYDATGRRLNNGEFRRVTAGRVFLTDVADIPTAGVVAAVHSDVSDWQWDKAWPAAIVVPGQRYKLLVQWELPEVGKMLFTLDNGGNLYRVDQAGNMLELDLNREIASSSLAALRRDAGAADVPAAIAQSEQQLLAGDAAMAATPPDTARAVRAFALSVKASLEAHEQLVLAQAAADIERNRKGDVDVTIVDGNGAPLSGASVEFRQTTNDFIFGANPLGHNGSYDPRLADIMREAGINESYVTARWGLIEPRQGEWDWSNIDAYQRPVDQRQAGFGLLGALSLWFTPNEDFLPRYLRSAGFSGLSDAVYRYGFSLAQHYAGSIDIWELNELNLATANVFDLDWNQRIEIGRVFASAVKAGNPKAQIMSGSLALAYDSPDSRPLAELLGAGLPADMVGLELYQAGVNTDGVGVVGLDLVTIDRLLAQYAAFGKPIVVKEFSAPSAQVDGSSWWHRAWDEGLQAEFATKVYTIAFSKRLLCGITWSWGVSDTDAYIQHGGLVDEKMRPKEAYFALRTLLASWRTRGMSTTDAAGNVAWRGFGGTYQLTVARDGREVLQTSIHVAEQQRSHFVLRVTDAIQSPGVSE